MRNTFSLRSACDFCDESAGGYRNSYCDRYGQSATRVIVEDSSFRLIPTLGQIVPGHVLIVPQGHYCACADLPASQIPALELLRRRLRVALERAYGGCVFFEHGIRGEGSGGCGIDHAHMHAVPVAAHGVVDRLRQEFTGISVDSLEDVRSCLPENSSYLLFEDVSECQLVFPVRHIPSQYLRKLVAESIGRTNWDWRMSGAEPGLASTIERLSPLLCSRG